MQKRGDSETDRGVSGRKKRAFKGTSVRKRGALDVHRGASWVIWASARERAFEAFRSVSDACDLWGGVPKCKRVAPYESHGAPPSSYRVTALRD